MNGEGILRALIQSMCAGGAIATFAFAPPTFGQPLESNAFSILTVEGAKSCNNFAVNSQIKELKKNNPPAFFEVSSKGQKIQGAITDENLSWEVLQGVPLNFVIVTGGGGGGEFESEGGGTKSNVYIFGSGATSDVGEIAPNMANIKQIRFCYGQDVPFQPRPLQACDSEDVGQTCPAEGQQVRIIWDLARPNDVSFCTCNIDFETCDLTPGATENACFPRTLEAVNSTIELYNTPFCLTSTTGGKPRKGSCF